MRFRTLFQVALVSVGMLGLGACDTVNQTMSDTGDWFSRNNPFQGNGNAASTSVENGTAVIGGNNCMPVSVVDDLKTLSQFSNDQAPRAENNVSAVAITNVSSSCTKNDKNYSIDLDITFNGTLGPKAHSWNADKPSFAYPYFVAITLPDGTIVTKEVFGVTLSYADNQTNVEQHEHMRQVIPLQSQAGQPQQIVIGFQLTESQLAYNRSLLGKQNEAAGPVAADIAPAAAAEETKKPVKKKAKKHKAKKKVVKKAPAPAKTEEAPANPPTASEPAASEKTEAAPAPAATESAAPPANENPPEVQATPPSEPPASAPSSEAAPAPAPAPAEPAKSEEPQAPAADSSGTENLMNPPSDSGTGSGE